MNPNKNINLILGGGGVKGIAFIGALQRARQEKYCFKNFAGVSAGSIVGSLMASGFSPFELVKILEELRFEKIKMEEVIKRVPVISQYKDYMLSSEAYRKYDVKSFFNYYDHDTHLRNDELLGFEGSRGNVFKSIITFCKEGCLFDGDYLEEWIYKVLKQKGVVTFADLRGGVADEVNPMGYKVRMTAVDANRGKLVVLPDDIIFYDMNPDRLEVSKAVRMSSSVPFVFKPVVVRRKEGTNIKSYNLVDGGVLDSLPFWLVSNLEKNRYKNIGIKLIKTKNGIIKPDTPLKVLKHIISSVHDFGVPDNIDFSDRNIIKINTGGISFLDFDLSIKEKEFLIKAGNDTAEKFFS